ncbi:MAG: hypothetical protein K0S40_771 [Actinomycetospora sp.]|jgi:hypothetical protein|nr:hypothetical protein [Actinomycetospora sp.]
MGPPRLLLRALADVLDLGGEAAVAVGLLAINAAGGAVRAVGAETPRPTAVPVVGQRAPGASRPGVLRPAS